jgi:hypothetical protein
VPCHCVDDQSAVSHRGGPGSFRVQSVWELWLWGRFFVRIFRCSAVRIISRMVRTLLQLHVSFTGKKTGRSLGTLSTKFKTRHKLCLHPPGTCLTPYSQFVALFVWYRGVWKNSKMVRKNQLRSSSESSWRLWVSAGSAEMLGPVCKTARCHNKADEAYMFNTMERSHEN